MIKNSSKKHNKNSLIKTSNITKERMICKDGFCQLPNQKEISKQDMNDINLFDPI
tara:strand:+ start:5 stop:169 length:165 start_codon:yes stop_codon:yes gene_type:complete